MFTDKSRLLTINPAQRNYGIAVIAPGDNGALQFFVAGFGAPNLRYRWNGTAYAQDAPPVLADAQRQAIGVAAGDIDGDGREEIYILNTDTFAGRKQHSDRLFDDADEWINLFDIVPDDAVLNRTAGRSVGVVDRTGNGRYGFFVVNYGGAMRLYEMDDDGRLYDAAPDAGVAAVTGGRGVLPLPLVSSHMDIFVGNENGANFLFRNDGNGHYTDIAAEVGLADAYEHVRGIAAVDMGDPTFGLVYGNWEGAHRLFVQSTDGQWDDIAPPLMARASRIRTVITADFDNDGYQEIFFNNLGEDNRLFGFREGEWVPLNLGDATERNGYGTGAAVADLDNDGRLELLVSHGEQAAQPLTLYHTPANGNHYLRVMPLTPAGAPARGALVTLHTDGRTQRRAIDAGSGYLCQMEPVAHFGLGSVDTIDRVEIHWLDGETVTLNAPAVDQFMRIAHPQRRTPVT